MIQENAPHFRRNIHSLCASPVHTPGAYRIANSRFNKSNEFSRLQDLVHLLVSEWKYRRQEPVNIFVLAVLRNYFIIRSKLTFFLFLSEKQMAPQILNDFCFVKEDF